MALSGIVHVPINNPMAPWTLVRVNDKHLAHLNIIKNVLTRLHYTDKNKRLIRPDPKVIHEYDASCLEAAGVRSNQGCNKTY